MRERIYTLLNRAKPGDKVSKLYDYFISVVALLSLVPLMFKSSNEFLRQLDTVMVYLLFLDYVLRWIVYDYTKNNVGKVLEFIKYPISIWAICDILSILPSLNLLPGQYRILRVLRIAKLLHYSKSYIFITNVLEKEKKTLMTVLIISLGYIYISALVMFSYEPDTFENFFEALYWATTALTTVGYGDVFPVSNIGRLVSMVSSIFGIAVIALPAGVVTAGFMEEIRQDNEKKEKAALYQESLENIRKGEREDEE